MPATRGLASKITSFPRVLLVKSSWASTPSTLPLFGINELIVWTTVGCARSAPLRTIQHYYFCISRRTKVAPEKTSGGRWWQARTFAKPLVALCGDTHSRRLPIRPWAGHHGYSDSPMSAPQRPDARQAHSEPLINRIGDLRSGETRRR
jgi:hypothetical protein